jgi:hypothetical protein
MWGNRGHGVLAEEIPSTGESGPAYLYPSLEFPADNGKEVRGEIVSWPSAGNLVADEYTRFEFTDAPDGTYYFDVQVYEDGAAVGSPVTFELVVGGGVVLVVQAITQSQNVAASYLLMGSALTVNGVSQSVSVADSMIVQHSALTVNGVSQSQTISGPLLTQAHVLTVDSVSQSQSLSSALLAVAGSLAVSAVTQGQSVSGSAITQHHVLAVDGVSQSQSIEPALLQILNQLLPDTVSQSQLLAAADLSQSHLLTVNAIAQAQSIAGITLDVGTGTALTVSAVTQGQNIVSSVLAQHGVLVVDTLTQTQVIDLVRFGGAIVGFLQAELVICSAINGEVMINKVIKPR